MPEYSTNYVFNLEVEGEEAVQAARKYHQQLSDALSQQTDVTKLAASAEDALAQATERANTALTSQTRRLTNYMAHLDQARAHVVDLSASVVDLYSAMNKAGLSAFDGLVKGAQAASDTIVGHSIIPDMVRDVKAQYVSMERAGMQSFGNLQRAAREAAAEIIDTNNRLANFPQSRGSLVAEGSAQVAIGASPHAYTAKLTDAVDRLSGIISSDKLTQPHQQFALPGEAGLGTAAQLIARELAKAQSKLNQAPQQRVPGIEDTIRELTLNQRAHELLGVLPEQTFGVVVLRRAFDEGVKAHAAIVAPKGQDELLVTSGLLEAVNRLNQNPSKQAPSQLASIMASERTEPFEDVAKIEHIARRLELVAASNAVVDATLKRFITSFTGAQSPGQRFLSLNATPFNQRDYRTRHAIDIAADDLRAISPEFRLGIRETTQTLSTPEEDLGKSLRSKAELGVLKLLAESAVAEVVAADIASTGLIRLSDAAAQTVKQLLTLSKNTGSHYVNDVAGAIYESLTNRSMMAMGLLSPYPGIYGLKHTPGMLSIADTNWSAEYMNQALAQVSTNFPGLSEGVQQIVDAYNNHLYTQLTSKLAYREIWPLVTDVLDDYEEEPELSVREILHLDTAKPTESGADPHAAEIQDIPFLRSLGDWKAGYLKLLVEYVEVQEDTVDAWLDNDAAEATLLAASLKGFGATVAAQTKTTPGLAPALAGIEQARLAITGVYAPIETLIKKLGTLRKQYLAPPETLGRAELAAFMKERWDLEPRSLREHNVPEKHQLYDVLAEAYREAIEETGNQDRIAELVAAEKVLAPHFFFDKPGNTPASRTQFLDKMYFSQLMSSQAGETRTPKLVYSTVAEIYGNKIGTTREDVHQSLTMWGMNYSRDNHRLQLAAAQVLGASVGKWLEQRVGGLYERESSLIDRLAELLEFGRELTRGTLARYGIGPEDKLQLYRGMHGIDPRLFPAGGRVTDPYAAGNLLQSWSTQLETPLSFASQDTNGIIMVAEIAAKHIMSLAPIGLGSTPEREVVVARPGLEESPPLVLAATYAGTLNHVKELLDELNKSAHTLEAAEAAAARLNQDPQLGSASTEYSLHKGWAAAQAIAQKLEDVLPVSEKLRSLFAPFEISDTWANEFISGGLFHGLRQEVKAMMAELGQARSSTWLTKQRNDWLKWSQASGQPEARIRFPAIAGQVYGLEPGTRLAEQLAKLTTAQLRALEKATPATAALLKASQAVTYKQLAAAGFDLESSIPLYRGLAHQPRSVVPGSSFDVASMQPMTSWTPSPYIALEAATAWFGAQAEDLTSVLLQASVPLKAIVGTGMTGLGGIMEQEVSVLRTAFERVAPEVLLQWRFPDINAINSQELLVLSSIEDAVNQLNQAPTRTLPGLLGSGPTSTVLADLSAGAVNLFESCIHRMTEMDARRELQEGTAWWPGAAKSIVQFSQQLREAVQDIKLLKPGEEFSRELVSNWPEEETLFQVEAMLPRKLNTPVVGYTRALEFSDLHSSLIDGVHQISRELSKFPDVFQKLEGYVASVNVLTPGKGLGTEFGRSLVGGNEQAWIGLYATTWREIFVKLRPDRDFIETLWHEVGHSFMDQVSRVDPKVLLPLQKMHAEALYLPDDWTARSTKLFSMAREIEESIADAIGGARTSSSELTYLVRTASEQVPGSRAIAAQGRLSLSSQPRPLDAIYGATGIQALKTVTDALYGGTGLPPDLADRRDSALTQLASSTSAYIESVVKSRGIGSSYIEGTLSTAATKLLEASTRLNQDPARLVPGATGMGPQATILGDLSSGLLRVWDEMFSESIEKKQLSAPQFAAAAAANVVTLAKDLSSIVEDIKELSQGKALRATASSNWPHQDVNYEIMAFKPTVAEIPLVGFVQGQRDEKSSYGMLAVQMTSMYKAIEESPDIFKQLEGFLESINVLVSGKSTSAAFAASQSGLNVRSWLGLYSNTWREIFVKLTPGEDFISTLWHEVGHAVMDLTSRVAPQVLQDIQVAQAKELYAGYPMMNRGPTYADPKFIANMAIRVEEGIAQEIGSYGPTSTVLRTMLQSVQEAIGPTGAIPGAEVRRAIGEQGMPGHSLYGAVGVSSIQAITESLYQGKLAGYDAEKQDFVLKMLSDQHTAWLNSLRGRTYGSTSIDTLLEQFPTRLEEGASPSGPRQTILADMQNGLITIWDKVFDNISKHLYLATEPGRVRVATQDMAIFADKASEWLQEIKALPAGRTLSRDLQSDWPTTGLNYSLRAARAEGLEAPIVGVSQYAPGTDPMFKFEAALTTLSAEVTEHAGVFKYLNGFLNAINVVPATPTPTAFMQSQLGGSATGWLGMYENVWREIFIRLEPSASFVDSLWHEVGHAMLDLLARVDPVEADNVILQYGTKFAQAGFGSYGSFNRDFLIDTAIQMEEVVAENVQMMHEKSSALADMMAALDDALPLGIKSSRDFYDEGPRGTVPETLYGSVTSQTMQQLVADMTAGVISSREQSRIDRDLMELSHGHREFLVESTQARGIGSTGFDSMLNRFPLRSLESFRSGTSSVQDEAAKFAENATAFEKAVAAFEQAAKRMHQNLDQLAATATQVAADIASATGTAAASVGSVGSEQVIQLGPAYGFSGALTHAQRYPLALVSPEIQRAHQAEFLAAEYARAQQARWAAGDLGNAQRYPLVPLAGGGAGAGGTGGGGGGGGSNLPVPYDMFPGSHGARLDEVLGEWREEIPGATQFLKDFADGLNKATMEYFGLRRLGYGLQSVGRSLEQWGSGVIGNLKNAADAYLTLNDVATQAAAAMELPVAMQPDLERALQGTAVQLGRFSAEELAEGLRLWSAGTGTVVHSQEDLNKVLTITNSIQKLSAMNNTSLATTTSTVAAVLAEYGLAVEDVTAVTGVLNYVAAKTFANVDDVGEAFRMVGPVAASLGVTFTETAGALGLLSDANIKGSTAGRALRQLFTSLLDPSAEANKAFNNLLGTNTDLANSWKKVVFPQGQFVGLTKFIDLLAAATENLNEQQRNERLAVIATANELPSLITLVNEQIEARKNGINVLSAFEKTMLGVSDAETRAYQDLAGTPTATSAGDLFAAQWERTAESAANQAAIVEQRWTTAMQAIGQATMEVSIGPIESLVGILQKVAYFAQDHPSIVGAVGLGAVASVLMGKMLTVVGNITNAAANLLILRGAFAQFGGAVGTFNAAVAAFAASTGRSDLVTTASATGGVSAGIGAAVGAAGGLGLTTVGILAIVRPIIEAIGKSIYGSQGKPELSEEKLKLGWQLTGGGMSYEEYKDQYRQSGYRLEGDKPEEVEETADAYAHLADALDDVNLAASRPATLMMPEGYEDVLESYQDYLDDRDQLSLSYVERSRELQTARGDAYVEETGRYLDDTRQLEQDHYDKLQEIADTGLKQRNDIYERYNERLEDAAADLALRISDAQSDYSWSTRYDQEDYLRGRQDIIDDFNDWVSDRNDDMADEEAEHLSNLSDLWDEYQEEQRRSHEDHVDSLWDLVAQRDARGLLNEARAYQKANRRREEDYQKSVQRENERWAKYQEESARAEEKRREELAERLAAYDEAEARRQERAAENLAHQIEKMQEAYQRQLAQIAEDRDKDLIDLEESIAEKEETEQKDYEKRQTALDVAHKKRLEAIEENYRVQMDREKQLHDQEMDQLEIQAKQVINQQVDAIEGITRATARPWQEQLQALETWLGRQLQALSEFETELSDAQARITEAWTSINETYDEFLNHHPTIPPQYEGGGDGGSGGGTGSGGGGGAVVMSKLPAMSYARFSPTNTGLPQKPTQIVVEQSNWVFEGSMSESDKAWFKSAAKKAAFEAVAEVL